MGVFKKAQLYRLSHSVWLAQKKRLGLT